MKTKFYTSFWVGMALCFGFAGYAQTFPPGQAAKFGIDGDISSDVRQNGTFSAAGSHDWFQKTGGAGLGLIDTTGAAALRSQIIAGNNIAFTRRMQFPRYSVQDGVVMIDGCYARDYMSNDKTSFTGNGTKNTTSPLLWGTAPGGSNVSDKTDIIDSYVCMRRNGSVVSGSGVGNLVAAMALTTLATGGDRYADFEFYKERIDYNTTTGKFINSGPVAYGGHSLWEFNADGTIKSWGDLTISFTFSSTTVSDIKVYIWVAQSTFQSTDPKDFDFVAGDFNASTSAAGYGYAAIKPNGAGLLSAWGSVNTATTGAPAWGSNSKDLGNVPNNYFSDSYGVGQFAEAAVDFTSLGIDPATIPGMSPCNPPFTRFMTKARSSASFSSSLADFNGPFAFLEVPDVPATVTQTGPFTCAVSTVLLSAATYSPGAYYTWTTADGNIIGSNADSSSITVNKAGKYYLTAGVTKDCIVNVDSVVVATDNWKPKATAKVAGMLLASRTVQLYGGDTTLSNYPTPFGGSQGLLWDWRGPFGFSATRQNPITSVPGFHTLVVTEKRNGCKDTAVVYVVPYPILPLRFKSFAVRTNRDENVNQLFWDVLDASGTKEFVVEKSSDGNSFLVLGKLLPAETKNAYTFNDRTGVGSVYYRIKAVDYLGKPTYSSIAKADEAAGNCTMVYRTANNVVLSYSTRQDETLSVELTNAAGQIVWDTKTSALAGNNLLNLRLPDHLGRGIYFITVQGRNTSFSNKFRW